MTFLGLYRASPLRPLVTVVLKFAASPIRTPALVLCGALLCASMPTPVRAQQWPSADADQTVTSLSVRARAWKCPTSKSHISSSIV